MNTTSHRVYQTGEGERGSEVAANDLGCLRIRLRIIVLESQPGEQSSRLKRSREITTEPIAE